MSTSGQRAVSLPCSLVPQVFLVTLRRKSHNLINERSCLSSGWRPRLQEKMQPNRARWSHLVRRARRRSRERKKLSRTQKPIR